MMNYLYLIQDVYILKSRQHDDDYTTRISLDVRIIPVEDYEWKVLDGRPLYRGKGRMGAEFRPVESSDITKVV